MSAAAIRVRAVAAQVVVMGAPAADRARAADDRRARTPWRERAWRLASMPGRWHELHRQRRQLRALASDDRFLADLGLSRADALREATKPFWKD